MTIKHYLIVICAIFFIFAGSAVAQFGKAELDILEQRFKSFEYEQVITLAEQIVADKERLTPDQLVSIYKFRALSNYSLLQMDYSLKDFIEILKINPDFNLDPVTTSPKIITFFNEIKSSLSGYETTPQVQEIKRDTVRVVSDHTILLKNMMVRSIVLPGWGHLYLRKTEKGFLLFTIGAASMAGSAYYLVDCYNAQKDYLNANNPDVIEKKYSDYNRAYKNRNLFLTAYALAWLYSQTDVLFSQSKKLSYKITFTLAPVTQPDPIPGICCSIHF